MNWNQKLSAINIQTKTRMMNGSEVPAEHFYKFVPYLSAITNVRWSIVSEAITKYLNGGDSVFKLTIVCTSQFGGT